MIETERLLLRPYTTDDFGAYWAMLCQPAECFVSRDALSREEAWQRVLAAAGHWTLFGYGVFAVIDKATGRYCGETGLVKMQRDLGDCLAGCDEAGWYFTEQARGRGLGLEAAQAMHGWHGARFGKRRTYCIVDSRNAPSLKLASKLGYEPRDKRRCGTHELLIFERSLRVAGGAGFVHAPARSLSLH